MVCEHDWGGHHFIAAELVEGETLRQRLQRSSLSTGAALEIASQIATALAAAHASGIIHRDIKPENVMIRPDGLVKVLDVGLAKLSEGGTQAGTAAPTRALAATSPGMVLGTAKSFLPFRDRSGAARRARVESRITAGPLRHAISHPLPHGRSGTATASCLPPSTSLCATLALKSGSHPVPRPDPRRSRFGRLLRQIRLE